jgi:hypothetical protein
VKGKNGLFSVYPSVWVIVFVIIAFRYPFTAAYEKTQISDRKSDIIFGLCSMMKGIINTWGSLRGIIDFFAVSLCCLNR